MSDLTIFKYPFPVLDEFCLVMPAGARILSLDVQRDAPCIWALVDRQGPVVVRNFALRGTAHDCSGLLTKPFIGTFQLDSGAFVGHVFDLGESPRL